MNFGQEVLDFVFNLHLPFSLPEGIKVMNPFEEPKVKEICEQFYHRYYNDSNNRFMIVGINPGRFGGGITGIPFTDPIRLEHECNISNGFTKQPELSSAFVYDM